MNFHRSHLALKKIQLVFEARAKNLRIEETEREREREEILLTEMYLFASPIESKNILLSTKFGRVHV